MSATAARQTEKDETSFAEKEISQLGFVGADATGWARAPLRLSSIASESYFRLLLCRNIRQWFWKDGSNKGYPRSLREKFKVIVYHVVPA